MNAIRKRAAAGTLESSDAMVEIEPWAAGIQIDVESVVEAQFGESIRQAAREVLEALEVENARVRIVDRGALDCVIRARLEAAVLRGRGE